MTRTTQGVRLRSRLTEAATARLAIYHLAGGPVRSWGKLWLPAGVSVFDWDGSSDAGERLPSGPYFCCLTFGRTEPVVLTVRVGVAR